MQKLLINTKKDKEVMDITRFLNDYLIKSVYEKGLLHVFLTHTTCCLTTADMDEGTDLDLLEFLEKLTPAMNFRHKHDPEHTPSHIISSIIGTSLIIPVENASMVLGSWQKVVLIELDGPKERRIAIMFAPDKRKRL